MNRPTAIHEAAEAFTYQPPDDTNGIAEPVAFILWIASLMLLVTAPAVVIAVWRALL